MFLVVALVTYVMYAADRARTDGVLAQLLFNCYYVQENSQLNSRL